eukprot:1195099-Prorocentrum_minimum.AAC.2
MRITKEQCFFSRSNHGPVPHNHPIRCFHQLLYPLCTPSVTPPEPFCTPSVPPLYPLLRTWSREAGRQPCGQRHDQQDNTLLTPSVPPLYPLCTTSCAPGRGKQASPADSAMTSRITPS